MSDTPKGRVLGEMVYTLDAGGAVIGERYEPAAAPPEGVPDDECDENCTRCSGEYCDTHFANPCDCDVLDRHAGFRDARIEVEREWPAAPPEGATRIDFGRLDDEDNRICEAHSWSESQHTDDHAMYVLTIAGREILLCRAHARQVAEEIEEGT